MGTSLYDRYLAETGAQQPVQPTSLYDQYLASQKAPQNGAEKLHAEFKRGTLGGRMQRENANDAEAADAENPSLSTLIPGALANASHGIPGAELAQAGARSLVRGQPFKQALGDIRGTVEQIPSKVSTLQHVAGAVPLAEVLPSGAIAGGATLGAADAALSPDDESLAARAAKTVGGGVAGAVGGALLKGAGNVAQRTGVTDAIAGGLSKLGGKAAAVAQAIGTRGAGNRLLGQRQQVADELAGSEQSAAQTMLDHVENYKAQAKQLYGAAKQDTKVVGNPRVQTILSDPRVQQMLDMVRERLGTRAPAQAQTALTNMAETGFAGGAGDATVIVPHGQKFLEATSPQNTVAMMAAAVKKVGQQDFRAQVQAEVARRGVKGNVDAEKAAVEQVARNIVGSTAAISPAARSATGRLRANLRAVSDEDLSAEIDRLSERQGLDGAAISAHFEHPDTEAAMQLRGGGNREDAAGLVDPKTHQEMAMLRSQFEQRQKALDRLKGEMAQRQSEVDPGTGDTSFEFGANAPRTAVARPRPPLPSVHHQEADPLPTPEELAMTKRLLSQVVSQKFGAPQGISSAEAAQLSPLLDDLRSALHEASPAWKQADSFYANAKNFETAYQKAFGVQQKVTASGLDPSKLKNPASIAAWAAKAKGSTGIARASGVQAGTAGRLAEALNGAPLGTNIAETLKGANGVFQPSAAAAAVRRPAFATPEAAQLFSGKLGDLVASGEKEGASFGPQSASMLKPWQALTKQNTLATPSGTSLRFKLSSMLADPAQAQALRAQLEQSREGQGILRSLLSGSLAAGNAYAAR